MRVANNLTDGVTSHLEESDTGDDATEGVAVTGDLDVLDDDVRAGIAGAVDSAGLVSALNRNGSTGVARRLTYGKEEKASQREQREWEKSQKRTLGRQDLVGGGKEDGSLEVDGRTRTQRNDGVGTTVVCVGKGRQHRRREEKKRQGDAQNNALIVVSVAVESRQAAAVSRSRSVSPPTSLR